MSPYGSARISPLTRTRGLFSDDEDEGHGASSSGTSSGASAYSFRYQRPSQFRLDDIESDDESSFERGHMSASATSGVFSDSPSIDQSYTRRGNRFFFDRGMDEENAGTLVGVESPTGPKIPGGTPTLELDSGPTKLYARHNWKKSYNSPSQISSITPEHYRTSNRFAVPETPSYGSASLEDFISPPARSGPLGSGKIGSLTELYHSPTAGFNLDTNLWPTEDRRYIKVAKPPPAPGSKPFGVMSITGRIIPREFLLAVEYGQKHSNKALSSMKWKKTFISGNSATVYGIELNGENFILKITKHVQLGESHSGETPQCIHESDIKSLQESLDPCEHKPKNGLIRKSACSAESDLVPFEYYVAEKVALTRGLMPAAASVANTFGKDEKNWYLIFEEIPGISPLKYGENILERLAKPLIREQLEALKQIATCHIMHLDAHWGNILYSRERGIQLIDFGIATLVDQFELPDYKAALIVTFTLDRCLDCEASKSGRDFQHLVKSQYPINGHSLLSHPWLQY
ncbi:hypothetical protein I4U23_030149 [Adineta vaga]|nr:hypothetical protein I4U23_030149 [Adineta vaga]